MKIYEIGTGYTPIPAQVAAATESVVEELTKAFIKTDEIVEIIDICAEKRVPNELPVTEVKVPAIFTRSDVSLGVIHKMKRVVYSVALSLKLKKILKKEKEKIVLHFHNQYNLFFFTKLVSAKLRAKAIVAYTNHNGMWSLPIEESEQILKKRYFQEISAMKYADIIFVLNSKTEKNISEYLNIDKKKICLIANGANTEIYSPLSDNDRNAVKAKYDLADKKVILQVGSVYENKGQSRAVEMLADLLKNENDVIYAFAGGIVSQEYFDAVKEKAKSIGVEEKVLYLGTFSPGQQMNELYNMADATIFLSKYEGFPLVCIESLSTGVPVVLCSDSLDSFGEGCIASSAEKVCADISSLILTHDEQYIELCKNARATAINQYTWEIISAKYAKEFKKIAQ